MPPAPPLGWPPPPPTANASAEEFNAWARDNFYWHRAHRLYVRAVRSESNARLLLTAFVFSSAVNVGLFVRLFFSKP